MDHNQGNLPPLREMLERQLQQYAQKGIFIQPKDTWVEEHRSYLRQHLPRRYEVLQQEQILDLACLVVAAQATEVYADLVAKGMPPDQAKIVAREQVLLPTSEEATEQAQRAMQEVRTDAQEEQAAQVVQALRQ